MLSLRAKLFFYLCPVFKHFGNETLPILLIPIRLAFRLGVFECKVRGVLRPVLPRHEFFLRFLVLVWHNLNPPPRLLIRSGSGNGIDTLHHRRVGMPHLEGSQIWTLALRQMIGRERMPQRILWEPIPA